ncbi:MULTISPECIES: methyltransferase [unclassified Mesorhizobium]|uniref:tRNA1(Val) (adenine(37)-N6)-methyltransferase n=1 Tax=unclassified Mesorhizobium TaxID=325217 RepID=UPI000BAFCB21|nr:MULTISPECIES: methyltransferase [unclassified Mesorhizobium]TGT61489.1 methyltransferase domain-containing protein [Mesorhizobium sp. M00.F.Ca.ET.170.01.1.1]AZO09262.1 methyltransferase domain-containing protein [Mesorhizobium sp. M3A.F.Ca.ET.080.04.2.1]PBB87376.1 methyltransferase [Mesorhizobium sp. WSM3876]RWB74197.1 MAG: methyltransferase domain-containing protein [Mesorhizobium sp.]RWB88463.1 MAG: methyltransferase domain-containing protein [Mesorhizobium sp.]
MAASSALSPDTPAHTVDAFHRGRFWLVQPRQGHRAGMDAMMLAAAVPSGFSGRLADFGAGAGAAALAVLSRCPQARAVLVERSAKMASFAAATLAHPGNAHLGDRASVLTADVTLAGRARAQAGLADNSFDFAIMNPPFNGAEDRATPDTMRKEAHVMEDGLFERWIRSAAAVVKPRGGLAVIARPEQLVAILDAMEGRFGDAEMLCVHPRPEGAAIRIVIRAVLGARGKLSIQPPLILHGMSGNEPTERTEMINNGLASLFGD